MRVLDELGRKHPRASVRACCAEHVPPDGPPPLTGPARVTPARS